MGLGSVGYSQWFPKHETRLIGGRMAFLQFSCFNTVETGRTFTLIKRLLMSARAKD